jgi:L-ascorbate metabolism protein UlaG (beta-lactamase superfamily)
MHPFTNLPVPEGSVGIHWFGQSSYALKDAAGTIALVDPYFPRERTPERFIHPRPPLDEATLRTDFVLLTHDHGDHTYPESLARIHAAWPLARFVGPRESADHIRTLGIPEAQITVISAGETARLGTMGADAVYAKPPGGDPAHNIPPPDVTHLGYVVEVGTVRVYISGDPIHTFPDLEDLVNPVAALRPDIGFLTNHPTEGEFPFFDGSVRMAQRVGLKVAVPAHYACFVKRDYDPKDWSAAFPAGGPQPLVIAYNGAVVYPEAG